MPRPLNPISAKLGILKPDVDECDDSILGLFVDCTLELEGTFSICFPDIDDELSESDWIELIQKFDRDYSSLVDRIPKVRFEVEEDVRKLHSAYFPKDIFQGCAKQLVSHFSLKHVNYHANGEVGIWYEGDKVFHCLDLNIELDKEWRVLFVNFDG
jgi:hypothetical protein